MKKIISVFLTAALITISNIGLSAATAIPSDKDPFGTSAFGPGAPEVTVDGYYIPSELNYFKQHKKYLEISVKVNGEILPLYISFPELGGFRLYGEKTGFFEPDSMVDISYEYDAACDLKMTGTDGTTVIFRKKGLAFYLDVNNKNGKTLFTIKSSQIKLGYSDGEVKKIRFDMPLASDEVIFGSGERFNSLDQNGRRTIMWNVDCGYHGQSQTAELWRGYKNVPVLHSSIGYTLFYNSFYSATVDIGYSNPKIYSLDFCGNEFDIYFWSGTAKENLVKYTDLTGKSVLPPKWAFRYLAGDGKDYWKQSTTDKEAALLESVLKKYAELGTPDIAAIYLEGITETDKIYNICNNYNVRYLKWNSPDLPRTKQEELLPDIAPEDIPIVKNINTGADSGAFIDFTSKFAGRLMSAWLDNNILSGLRGGIIDFGELIQPTAVFSNGLDGNVMHNRFSYHYAKSYYDEFKKETGNDFVLFSRAGCAGMQSFAGCFSGDQAATFYGLKRQLIAGLSAAASGFAVWGGDLAGYEGKPTNEVYCRGMELSAFYPVMRAHGTRTRMPWDFGNEGIATYQKYYWLRENLLDSVYSAAVKASKSGLPIMRPLALEYPEETTLLKNDDSYIFCENLLVAPVLTEGATSRSVSLPTGTWYDFWNGQRISGGQTLTVDAPLTFIPVFVKEGTVMPLSLSDNLQLTESMQDQTAVKTLLVTPPDSERDTEYFIDEKTSVHYFNALHQGGYRVTAIGNNEAKTLLAYGTEAVSVIADGAVLKKYSEQPSVLAGNGFCINGDGNTVVWLESNEWNTVDFITSEIKNDGNNNVVWDFSTDDDLDSFDAYIFDERIGYENQPIRRLCRISNGRLMAVTPFTSASDSDKRFNWAGISKGSLGISPGNVKLRNFETEIVFKCAKGAGATGAVMVGYRENKAGVYKPLNDSWAFGNEDASNKIYSGLVAALTDDLIWCYNAGIQTVNAKVNASFITGPEFYRLKVRVVENRGNLVLKNSSNEIIYETDYEVYNNLNAQGALTYYINGDCQIDSISLTGLDTVGRNQPLYSDSGLTEYQKLSVTTEKYIGINNIEHGNILINTGYKYDKLIATVSYDPAMLSVDCSYEKGDPAVKILKKSGNSFLLIADSVNGNDNIYAALSFMPVSGDCFNTEVKISDISLIRADGSRFKAQDRTAGIQLNRHLVGDANNDLKIDIRDLVIMKKHLSGLNVNINRSKSDCNLDGMVDISDMILLRKYLIGAIENF